MEMIKRVLTKEKFDRQEAGQAAGAIQLLMMTEEDEERHKVVVFDESNMIGDKINKLASVLGKLSTQNRQSKPFKQRIYQGRGQPLKNSGIEDQCTNGIRFYDKGRS